MCVYPLLCSLTEFSCGIHCSRHCGSKLFFWAFRAMYRFFSVSTLRHDVFINVQKRKSMQVLEIPQLSDTRWVCRYIAVRLFQTCYEDILEALDSISKGTDRSTAAESFGLAFQLRSFSSTVLLCVFEELLGLTKPLSGHLQATEISLCHAIDLVQAVVKTLESNRSDIHFFDSIWKKAIELASERNIELDSAIDRRSRQPSRLTDSIVCETTGSRADSQVLRLNIEEFILMSWTKCSLNYTTALM